MGTVGNKKIYKCSECSTVPIGKITAFAINSNQGPVRPYNEDRVIAFNTSLISPHTGNQINYWFFGVYDGHGGQSWSKFLVKELHFSLIEDKDLHTNPRRTLNKHILNTDK